MQLKAILAATAALLLCVRASGAPDLRLKTVVIDPGHGGKDSGCVSRDGKSYEKNFVLDISQRFRQKVEDEYDGQVKVLLTRSNDRFIPLMDRSKYATRNKAALFISIHINAQKGGTSANGFSVHLLGQSDDPSKDTYAFNRDVCQRENDVILLEDDYSTKYKDLAKNDPETEIYLNLMQAAYREQSLLFGQIVSDRLQDAKVFRRNNGIMQNNFAVLRLATMPAALLELGFISNPDDLATLRNADNIEKIAQSLFESFKIYKEIYDSSVAVNGITEEPEPPKAQPEPVPTMPGESPSAKADKTIDEPAPAPEKTDAEIYGIQIFASSREIAGNDPRLLGYEPKVIAIPGSNVKKYVIGISASPDDAKKKFSTIKNTYPDAFIVIIKDGVLSRLR